MTENAEDCKRLLTDNVYSVLHRKFYTHTNRSMKKCKFDCNNIIGLNRIGRLKH